MRSPREQPVEPLPPMQQRVFDQICLGKSTAEIAQTLGTQRVHDQQPYQGNI